VARLGCRAPALTSPRPQMCSGGPGSLVAGLPGVAGDDLEGSRDGALQLAYCSRVARASRARTGLTGHGVLSMLCPIMDRLSAVEAPAWPRGSYSFPRRCPMPLLLRPQANVMKRLMSATRSWLRMMVGDEIRWWCSGVSGLFCERGGE
jgi:hypothetical protein